MNQLVVLESQSTPMQEYRKLVEAGGLRLDDHQTRIIQKLQNLHDALAVYAPPPPAGTLSLVSMCPPFLPFIFH
jgi:predicted ATPase